MGQAELDACSLAQDVRAGLCRAQLSHARPKSRPLEHTHAGAPACSAWHWQLPSGLVSIQCGCCRTVPTPDAVQDKYGLDVDDFGYDPNARRPLPPANSPDRPAPASQSRYCSIM